MKITSVMKKAGFIRWRAVIQKRCRRSICAGDSRFSRRILMCWEAFCSAFRMPDTVITAERPTVLPSAIGASWMWKEGRNRHMLR